MGIAFGALLGPFCLAALIGVFLKLVLDAISNTVSGHPFKYLGWVSTVLLIAVMSAGFMSLVMANSPLLPLRVLLTSTLFGFIALPIVAIFGIAKSAFKKTPEESTPQPESKIKRKWTRWWLGATLVYPLYTILYIFITSDADPMGTLLGALVLSFFFGLIAYPFVLICIKAHTYLKSKN